MVALPGRIPGLATSLSSRLTLAAGIVVLVALSLTIWGGDAKVAGAYSNKSHTIGIDFGPDNMARFIGGGPPIPYSVSGRTIFLDMPDGLQTIHVSDEDTLKVADKAETQLLRNRSYVCSDADGEIGTLTLQNDGHVFLSAPAGSEHAKDGPQAFGTYTDSGSAITLKDPTLANVFSYRGTSDMKADTVTCKRI